MHTSADARDIIGGLLYFSIWGLTFHSQEMEMYLVFKAASVKQNDNDTTTSGVQGSGRLNQEQTKQVMHPG